MAVDPEARSSSNSAAILGIVALVLIVGAVAFFAMRPATDNPANPTTVVNNPAPVPAGNDTTIIEAPDAPAPASPDVVVVPPGGDTGSSSSSTSSSTTTDSDSATGTTTESTTTESTTSTETSP